MTTMAALRAKLDALGPEDRAEADLIPRLVITAPFERCEGCLALVAPTEVREDRRARGFIRSCYATDAVSGAGRVLGVELHTPERCRTIRGDR